MRFKEITIPIERKSPAVTEGKPPMKKKVVKKKAKSIAQMPEEKPKKISEIMEPIYGIEEADRQWVESLKRYDPAAYDRLRNWD